MQRWRSQLHRRGVKAFEEALVKQEVVKGRRSPEQLTAAYLRPMLGLALDADVVPVWFLY